MVVSVSSASGVGYYCGGGGGGEEVESYYTAGTAKGEAPGVWKGRLAAEIGLEGDVTAEVMTPVYTKFQAPDGTKLGRAPASFKGVEERVDEAARAQPDALPEEVDATRRQIEADQRQACLAVDLTFSPPKSVTVAHTAAWRAENEARARGDEATAEAHARVRTGIEAAIWAANEAAMEELASVATARAGSHDGRGVGYWVEAQDHVRASFHQQTARPVKGTDRASVDPQQHIHNVVLNRARCSDGQIRALDTKDVAGQKPAVAAVADRVLAQEMAKLGLNMPMRPDGVAREVEIVPPEVSELFSQRRRAMGATLEPLVARAEETLGRPLTDLERGRMSKQAALFSRVGKDGTEGDWDRLLGEWQDRMKNELGKGLGPLAESLRVAVEAAGAVTPTLFSPERTANVALAAVQQAAGASGTWNRADLLREVERAAPLMPELDADQSREMLNRVTDIAIEKHGVQVAGVDTLPSLGENTPGVGFMRPSARRFAAEETLAGEERIRDAAITRGRASLDRGAVDAWLTANYPTIGEDQRAAVVGLAGSDAALSVLSAPAGTGKSFATGAFAGAWSALGGGRVHGLAVSEIAAQVLKGDGVESTANVAAFLAAQDRIAAGKGLEADAHLVLSPTDVIVVDEASMVGSTQFDRIRDIAEQAGARMVASGDPRQLGAVDAGGVMDLLEGRAETYTLSEVRRFTQEWERDASLGLRAGDPEALAEYDRRGRLVGYETPEEAISGAARAAAADRLAGLSAVVVAATNEEASATAGAIRELLVAAGVVEEGGVRLGLDGNLAGVGDEVMARQIDREIGVLNRERFTVTAVKADGGLRVVDTNGEERSIPASYVGEHVQSAYASTVHSAQGTTVNRAHYLTSGGGDPASAYVGMTRGQDRNTAHVAVYRPGEGPQAATPKGGTIEVTEESSRPSPLAVLRATFDQEVASPAATVTRERDAERESGMKHLLERLEGGTSLAVQQRLEQHLDGLTAEGVLSDHDRARLCADQSTGHLARLMRAVEQAGVDPELALRTAVQERGFDDARSVAEVLSSRVAGKNDVRTAAPGHAPPTVSEPFIGYLSSIRDRMEDRARSLGAAAVEQPPEWAVGALGVPPVDPVDRLEWQDRAGRVAAYREAVGWADPDRAIDHAPGVTSTERRGLWWSAWESLGRPEATREEAALSDGSLQARVQAWERAQQWAPPHADDAMRAAEQDAERARQDAILAADEVTAAERSTEADRLEALARTAERVASGRSAWNQDTAQTRTAGERAAEELASRGLTPGQEPDRVLASEWLAEDRRARREDDAHRVVTEADIEDPEIEVPASAAVEAPVPGHRSAARERLSVEPGPEETMVSVDLADQAHERQLDHESEQAAWDAWEADQPQRRSAEAVPESVTELTG